MILFSCDENSDETSETNLPSQKGTSLTNKTEEISEPIFEKGLVKGKVVFEFKIDGKTEGDIAYYIPTEVEPSSVLILLDAQARGFLPIVRYRELADKFGFILIGSNISENGYPYPQTQEHFTIVKNWVDQEFVSLTDKVHLGGFSGGARVAGWLAFDFNFPSIFGCAAGVPNNDKEIINDKFFYGTTSTLDFNYRELNSLTEGFLALNHFVSIVEGYHDWVDFEEMELIFKWLKMNEMRLGKTEQNTELVTNWLNDYKGKLVTISNNTDIPIEIRYNAITKGSALFHDVLDISFFEKEKINFRESKSWGSLSKNRSIANYAEGSWTAKFGNSLDGENPIPVWNQYIDEVNIEIENAPNSITERGLKRIFSFVSLVGFLKMADSFEKENFDEAKGYMALVERVHPTNADIFYYKALFAIKESDITKAKEFLFEAVKNGFSNYRKLQNQSEFSNLNISELVKDIKTQKYN